MLELVFGDHYIDRGLLLLTWQLLNQWFLVNNLKSSIRNFKCRHHDLVHHYGIQLSQIPTDMFRWFVVIIIQSFLHSWLIIGFVTSVALPKYTKCCHWTFICMKYLPLKTKQPKPKYWLLVNYLHTIVIYHNFPFKHFNENYSSV